MIRTLGPAALALAVACAPASAQSPEPRATFVRVAEYTINTAAVTHVTEYNDRVTLWFAGRESTIFFEALPDRQAVRRWLEAHPADFSKVGPHYMRLAKITHTRSTANGLEVNFEGGNRFTLRNAQDVEALNNLLVPKSGK